MFFDLVVAAAAVALRAPLMLATAIAVRVKASAARSLPPDGPGWDGAPFPMIKFRTMRDARDADGRPLPDAERLTRSAASCARPASTSSPELWNVLRGDMSLVGPRPLLMDTSTATPPSRRAATRCARDHRLGPGQRPQRAALGEQFGLDVWYVDHWSLGLDLVLARTLLEDDQSGTASARAGMRPCA